MGFSERETYFIESRADWDAVHGAAGNLSLFAARRIIEIRLASAKPGVAGGAALLKLAQLNDKDLLVLIIAPRLDRDAQSADWVKAIESAGAWVQIWPVETQRLVAWLQARCRRLQLSTDDEALELLAERTEGNLLAAHQELQKLQLLFSDVPVTSANVLASVADSARYEVGQLAEAALAGDAARALHMLAGLKAEGVSVPFGRLTLRAERADRMIKGRLMGDAWDELALLAAEFCTRPLLPLPRASSNRNR